MTCPDPSALLDVPAQITAAEPHQAVRAISEVLSAIYPGRDVGAATVIYASHSALETGWWRRMHNWNFGNLRGSYYCLTQSIPGATEMVGSRVVSGPLVERGFRAYQSPGAGVVDFVTTIALDTTPSNGRRNRYWRAAAAALRGDVIGYAKALGAAGYYTTHHVGYARRMRRIALSSRMTDALNCGLRNQCWIGSVMDSSVVF